MKSAYGGKDRRSEAGQALAELAVVLGLMLVMMVSLFDIGRGVLTYMAIINGARDGARVAMDADATDAVVTAAAMGAAAPFEPAVSISRTSSGVAVTVTYEYEPMAPFFVLLTGASTLDMSARMVSR